MQDFEAPDWRALHSSVFRSRRFAFCPVGYYLYHVPGRDGYGGDRASWNFAVYSAKFRMSAKQWVQNLWRQSLRDSFQLERNVRRWSASGIARHRLDREFSIIIRGEYQKDPKLAPGIMELEERILTPEMLYRNAVEELEALIRAYESSALAEELKRVPWLDFRLQDEFWLWQLGGVNFLLAPELVWSAGGKLMILDTAHYRYEQEKERAVLLYEVYANRFLRIAPEQLCVRFFNIHDGRESFPAVISEDFSTLFPKLCGEAAMMKEYLVRQYADALLGIWHHPQLEHCSSCRFSGVCPARRGIPEPERDLTTLFDGTSERKVD